MGVNRDSEWFALGTREREREFRDLLGSVMCSKCLTTGFSGLKKKGGLICSIHELMWYKYDCHVWFQAVFWPPRMQHWDKIHITSSPDSLSTHCSHNYIIVSTHWTT